MGHQTIARVLKLQAVSVPTIYIVTKIYIYIYIVTKNAIVPGALPFNQLSYGGQLAGSDRYYGVCSSSIVLHNVGNERDT